jgi:hypothetical protein
MEPESSGRPPFCNRLRSALTFSRTSLGKPLITLKELPSKTTSGGEGSATTNNISEAGLFVYKYLYTNRPGARPLAVAHPLRFLSSPTTFAKVGHTTNQLACH